MWVYNRIDLPYIVVVIDIEPIRERFSAVAPFLDERGRRLVAAAEAFAAGYGGIAAVAMATGIAPSTIGRGLNELAWDEPSHRIRRPGAGRKPTISKSLPPRRRGTPRCSTIARRWSSRRRGVIPNRPGGGPARACAVWRRRCKRRVTRSAALWSANCSMRRGTACKATARPRRATAIPTGMRSSATSTPSDHRFGRKAAGDLGRHQEKGTGRRFPQQ